MQIDLPGMKFCFTVTICDLQVGNVSCASKVAGARQVQYDAYFYGNTPNFSSLDKHDIMYEICKRNKTSQNLWTYVIHTAN